MIKDLFHLLPCRHLFYKTVDIRKICLLPVIILFAPSSVPFNEYKHDTQEHDHDQRHIHIENEQHDYSASQSQRTLDHHGKTVIERLLHRIHIIGKPAHELSVCVVVEIF